jgi:hypothetical protein
MTPEHMQRLAATSIDTSISIRLQCESIETAAEDTTVAE